MSKIKMNIYVKILLFSLLTVIIQHLGKIVYKIRGYGNTFVKHYPGECKLVTGFTTNGSEDMIVLPSGWVIVSSGIQTGASFDFTKDIIKGAIYLMDPSKGYKSVAKLTVKGWPEDQHFEPHGMDYWIHPNNSVSLFVIVHMPEGVARFIYDDRTTLTLTKVYRNAEFLRNINSVVVNSEDSFYVTNIFNARGRDSLMISLEYLLLLPLASVVFIEGDNSFWAVEGLFVANGLAGDDRYLYVATMDAVRIYSRHSDNTLSFYKSIPIVIGSIDNLKLDSSGDLWIGCQTYAHEILAYLDDSNVKCHSTVLRVRDPIGEAEIEAVFADDTSLIQAASVAVYTNKKLLVGTIVDKMVSCDVNYLLRG